MERLTNGQLDRRSDGQTYGLTHSFLEMWLKTKDEPATRKHDVRVENEKNPFHSHLTLLAKSSSFA